MSQWPISEEIPEADLEDLASFTQLPVEECRARMAAVDRASNEKAWFDFNAQTDEDVIRYFASEERLLWAHFLWHHSPSRHLYDDSLHHVASNYPVAAGYGRVLDFGCGIGTDAMFFATRGYQCTLTDLDGPMFRFAKHRFQRRGIEAAFVESSAVLPTFTHQFDIILCLDVFEHLANPLAGLNHLLGYLRPGGIMVQFGNFEDLADVHPIALANGAARFGDGRWVNYVSGVGMRSVRGLIFQRERGIRAAAQRARFAVWRATGLWLSRSGIQPSSERAH